MLAAASARSLTGKRNRAVIAVLWRCGLRCSEALALRDSDIDMRAGTVRVLHGKGARARTVGIDPEALAVVQAWIAVRHQAGIKTRTLFCTLAGDPVGDRYVRDMLPRLARKAGIEKRVHAHGLRHTHAAELAAEHVPVNVISRQLGHSNVGTTSIYLDHVMPQQVIDTMKQRRWEDDRHDQ